jgi:hypothetical protein
MSTRTRAQVRQEAEEKKKQSQPSKKKTGFQLPGVVASPVQKRRARKAEKAPAPQEPPVPKNDDAAPAEIRDPSEPSVVVEGVESKHDRSPPGTPRRPAASAADESSLLPGASPIPALYETAADQSGWIFDYGDFGSPPPLNPRTGALDMAKEQVEADMLGTRTDQALHAEAKQGEMKSNGPPDTAAQKLGYRSQLHTTHSDAGGEEKEADPDDIDEISIRGDGGGLSEGDRFIIATSRETARLLGGVIPKPPPPTQQSVGGYLGRRGVENGDVMNSAASGNMKTPVSLADRKGDEFVESKQTHSNTTDTLRPQFKIAPPNAVVPSTREQIRSDIIFNDFGTVAPGFGLGVTNKMYLMEAAREKRIVYREPMSEPRRDDGPSGCVEPVPLEFQNNITRADRAKRARRENALEASAAFLETRAGAGSLNILGDDFGALQNTSDKGLTREAESPLEPVYRLPWQWERVKPLPGSQLSSREMRDPHDALRYPERFHPNMAQNGGPIMSKRNALSIFPFPVTAN